LPFCPRTRRSWADFLIKNGDKHGQAPAGLSFPAPAQQHPGE
jgi:hypothetical protein